MRLNFKAAPALRLAWGLLLFTLCSAWAILPPERAPLPNFDRRSESKPAPLSPEKHAAEAKLKKVLPGVKLEWNSRLGTPRWIYAPGKFLTGPEGGGFADNVATNEPHRAVKAFLNEHAKLFGHDARALQRARIVRDFTTPHNGLRTVIWQQEIDGIPVFDSLLIAHTTKRGELARISSQLVPENGRGPNKAKLSAPQAIARAAASLGETLSAEEVLPSIKAKPSREGVKLFTAKHALKGDVEARLVWLPMDAKRLRLCWEVILTSQARGETFRVLVDAESGEILVRHCLTNYLTPATYRVFVRESPTPMLPGLSTPGMGQPPFVDRTLITIDALSTNASPLGWISDGENETRGNNVNAYRDWNTDNEPDLPRVEGSPARVFDFPLDLAQSPHAYDSASVVQLFYWCNWMHDKLYDLGFTETAGNFQATNFARGGLGDDAVYAEAQDGGGFNNANMSTPPDGSAPRLQVYLFVWPFPQRDPTFDATIILHEYTHGLSNRRVGGGAGLTELQSLGLGEGWSDFYALALLSGPEADPDAAYPCGAYAGYELAFLRDNYYFGIRRYPYSTDLSKNPLTFKDLDPGQASPHPGIPVSSAFGAMTADESHAQGEVWCMMLWEARANLIHKLGAEAGNHLMLQLVTDAMNLSPANPTFVEARDAIIHADFLNSGGANFHELWRAFAKRGLGFSALCPDSSRTGGVRESFDMPDDLWILREGDLVMAGPVGGPFKPTSQSIVLTNLSTNTLAWHASAREPWINLSLQSGVLSTASPAATVVVSVNGVGTLLAEGKYTNEIVFTDETSGCSQTQSLVLRVGAKDYFTQPIEGEIASLAYQTFTFTPDNSPSFYSVCRQPAMGFPTSPAESESLVLGDDKYLSLTLAGDAQVSLYGKKTNAFFLGSNGYITFGGGDMGNIGSIAKHFLLPRIAGLLTDLNPAEGGRVSWQQLTDRMAVTFENVPEYNLGNSNSFQIEMFYDGCIRLTYLNIDAHRALVGLSSGGGAPVDFYPSDFSQYSRCGAQFALRLPAQVTEGEGLLGGQAQISLPAPAVADVEVSLWSSAPSEVQLPATVKILAGATNAQFDLQVLDDGVVDGTQIVTVRAVAPDYTDASATMWVHDRQTAILGWSGPSSIVENEETTQAVLTSSVPVAATVFVLLTSSDPTRVQVPPWVVIPSGSNAVQVLVRVVDNAFIDGNQPVSITAHVQNWVDAMANITVVDDENNSLSVFVPARTYENAGTLANPGEVRIGGILETNLTLALSSDNAGKLQVPASVTILAGHTNASFNISVQDDNLLDGEHLVAITASAPGFIAGSGTVLVLDDDVPPRPTNPLPFDRSSNQRQSLTLRWNCGIDDGDLMTNGGFENGSLDGWRFENSSGEGWRIDDGTMSTYSGDPPVVPFFGCYSVVCDGTGLSQHALFQDVAIPIDAGPVTLKWVQRIQNFAGDFAPNQQFRVEIRDTNNAVLRVLYSTAPGLALSQNWHEQSADLGAFRGQTVRIAFVEEDQIDFLNIYLDNVRVLVTPAVPTTYEVYLGTSPGSLQRLGTTTATCWELPTLAPSTTYFWQIIANRVGQTNGPVWQFRTAGANHFVWDPIPSPQRVGQPIPVRISAVPAFGPDIPDTNFSGPITISAKTVADTVLFTESFESGNLGAWRNDGGDYERIVSNSTAAHGQHSLKLQGGSRAFFDGVSRLLPNMAPDRINFSIRAARNDMDAGYFVAGTPPLDLQASIAFHLDPHGRMGFFGQSGEPLAVKYYVSNQWYNISLLINWVEQTMDYFVDGQLIGSNLSFSATSISLISIFNSDHAEVFWDQIELLNVTGSSQLAIGATTGDFHQGIWSGTVTLTNAAEKVQLAATDSEGHSGVSGAFTVLQPDELSVTVSANPGVAGQKLRYNIAIANPGPNLAKAITLTNLLPSNALFIAVNSSQGHCENVGEAIVCQLGNLDANASASVQIDVLPNRPQFVTNTLTACYATAGLNTYQTVVNITPIYPNPTRMAAYVRSQAESPWGLTENEATMDRVFGAANWQDFRYETVNVSSLFSTNTPFVYMEGSDLDAMELEWFLTQNRNVIEQWVANGGSLFINAAPNEDDGMALGFGAELKYPDLTDVAIAADFAHPIFSGPFAPAGTTWTGRYFAHATISGTGLRPLINNAANGRAILAEKDYGGGHVIFGGLAPAVFDRPQPEAANLLANILFYGASFSGRGKLDHFGWEPIDSPQIIGRPVPVTIKALDAFDCLDTNFADTVALSAHAWDNLNSPIALQPLCTGLFTNGVWSGAVIFAEAGRCVLEAHDDMGHSGRSEPVTLAATNDLSMTLAGMPAIALQGSNITYRVLVNNSGPEPATGVVLTDTLPETVSFVFAQASQGVCTNFGGQIVCELGALGSNETACVTITVAANSAGKFTNEIYVARADGDLFAGNNEVSAKFEVVPPVQIIADDVTVIEDDANYSILYIPVSLSATSALPVRVDFASVDGTATAGTDYVAVSGQLIFPPGLIHQVIPVKILGDTIFEGDETFLIILTNAVNAGLSNTVITATIAENEWPPIIFVNDARVREPETGSTNAVFEVFLTEPAAVTVSLDYFTSDGTGLAGLDYGATNGTVIFPPGRTNQVIAVSVNHNAETGSVKTFYLNVANATNGYLLMEQAVGTILDKDLLPTLTIADTSVTEGTGTNSWAVFTLSLSDPYTQTVHVHYATQDGTGAGGIDYTTTNGTVFILPGQTSTTISVAVIGDAIHEADKAFSVVLSDPVQAVLGAATAIATILDDDPATLAAQIIRIDNGYRLSWPSVAGLVYRVEFKNDLNDPSWSPLADDVVAGSSVSTLDDCSESHQQRFYRIRIAQ